MRIRKVYIENIASIEKCEIDFEDPILAGKSLFLITGSTGSGKSSILDAICLALYAKTPRLTQMGRTSESIELDAANGKKDIIRLGHPSNLLRRGTDFGCARLTFEGVDGRLYAAEWQISRGVRSKKVQTPKWILYSYCDSNDSSSADSVDLRNEEQIVKVTGLGYDQFCKTTLLAQGEFTKFLLSTSEEKSAILEGITGTEIYSSISIEVNRRYNEARNALTSLIERCNAISSSNTDPQTLIDLNEKLVLIDNEISHLKQKKSSAEKKVAWIKIQKALLDSLNDAKSKFEAVEKIVLSPSFIDKENSIAVWDKTERQRQDIASIAENTKLLSNEEEKKNELIDKYHTLLGWWLFESNSQKQKQNDADRLNEQLLNESANAPMYGNSPFIIANLDSIISLQKRNEKLISDLNGLVKPMCGAREEVDKIGVEIEKSRNELKASDTVLSGLNRDLEKLNPKYLSNREKCYGAVSEKYKLFAELTNKTKDLKDSLFSFVNDKKAKTIELEVLSAKCEAANKELKTAKSLYEDTANAFGLATRLIEKLHVGDVCPVCGNKISELHSDVYFATAIAPLLKHRDSLSEKSDSLLKQKSELEGILRVANSNIKEKSVQLEVEEKKLSENKTELFNLISTHYPDVQLIDVQIAQRLSVEKEQIAAQKMEMDTFRSKIDEQNRCRQTIQAPLTTMEEEYKKKKDILLGYITEEATIKKQYSQNQTSIYDHFKMVEPLISYPEGLEREYPDRVKARLSEDVKRYNSLISQKEHLEREIKEGHLVLSQIEEANKRIVAKLPQCADIEAIAVAPPSFVELNSDWSSLSFDVARCVDSISLFQSKIKTAEEASNAFYLANADIDSDMVRTLIEMYPDGISEVRNSVTSTRQEYEADMKSLNDCIRAQQKHSETCEIDEIEVSLDELEREMADIDGLIDEKNREVGRINEKKKIEEKRGEELKRLSQQREVAQKSYNKWSELNKFLGSSDGKAFRTIAQSVILGELLHYANIHLWQLTDRRFTLECGGSTEKSISALTIFVRDAHNGNSPLAASSLSGGESFMVSLALSLGLSSLAGAPQLAADIIFIDEGFGTLDGGCLEKVMVMLERLHEIGGRRVGIISHVDDLKERIRTQIVVEKKDNCRSEIRIVGC